MSVLIRLNGVSMAELESALKYSGLYVQTGEGKNSDYAEIKAIPASILHDDVRTIRRLQDGLEKSRNFEKTEVEGN